MDIMHVCVFGRYDIAVNRHIFIYICDFMTEDGREEHQEEIKEGLGPVNEVQFKRQTCENRESNKQTEKSLAKSVCQTHREYFVGKGS